MSLRATKNDITRLQVDAIVNAANNSLLGGGGVDGAIHRAAGPQLLEECRQLNGCPVGAAKITRGYLLPASHVIHTVGPVWQGGGHSEEELLAACYRNSLILALKKGLNTIAFPAISCGIYGFPVKKAAEIAIRTCRELIANTTLRVTFCLFSQSDLDIYQNLLKDNQRSLETVSDQNKFTGALIGSAVGDALGVPVEFVAKELLKANPVNGYRSFGSHQQEAGTWAASTSLALCTLQSLMQKGFDLQDIMHKFSLWKTDGYMCAHKEVFKIGHATEEAIQHYLDGSPREEWASSHDWQNGNGALTRILPIALYVHKTPIGNAVEKVFLASALTHGHVRSQLACAFFSLMVRFLLQGKSINDCLNESIKEISPYIPHDEEKHFNSLRSLAFLDKSLEEIHNSRYVLHTLEASLYCLYHSENFSEAVLKAVNLGDDCDASGCLTGAMAGIHYGLNNIPLSWRENLAGIDMLIQMAEDFNLKVIKTDFNCV